ncbi:MAG TPA: AAA family ATPase [Dehalococcoidia bacterium]|nr:AAA family ATPase [Dehalococcoidia bacterium]
MAADVWLISGIPGSGKSTTARLLAERFDRSVHIEGDLLHDWVVRGKVGPGDEPAGESKRQIRLCVRNQCLLARSFAEAGFTAIVDYVIENPAAHLSQLPGLSVRFVVLSPGREAAIARDRDRPQSIRHRAKHGVSIAERFAYLEEGFLGSRGRGLWLDTRALTPEQAVEAILERQDEALIQRAIPEDQEKPHAGT